MHPHLVLLTKALSLSTFCEFKFTSSELVSNQNQLDPWTILSLFAVNSYTTTQPPEATRSHQKPSGAG